MTMLECLICAGRGACLLLGVLLITACAPEPRNVPCTNDAQCKSLGDDLTYCLESRCVECLGSASCGDNGSCIDGKCEIPCGANQSCPRQRACRDSLCERM